MTENADWIAALKAKGHTPILDEDGDLDMWVCDYGIHNGPGCDTCGETWCQHCNRPADIGPCENPVIEGECREVFPVKEIGP